MYKIATKTGYFQIFNSMTGSMHKPQKNFFLQKYPVPDLPIYLNSSYLNKVFNQLQKDNNAGETKAVVNPVIPHVNLNHLLTSSIREEIISVGCTTRYEGKFITHVVYAPCYYENTNRKEELV